MIINPIADRCDRLFVMRSVSVEMGWGARGDSVSVDAVSSGLFGSDSEVSGTGEGAGEGNGEGIGDGI
jgi:hypothetical protein